MFRREPDRVKIGGMDADGLIRLLDDLYKRSAGISSDGDRYGDYCFPLRIRHKNGKFYVKLDGWDGQWLIEHSARECITERYAAKETTEDSDSG